VNSGEIGIILIRNTLLSESFNIKWSFILS